MSATIAAVLCGEARYAMVEADCLAAMPLLPGGAVAHCLTDPPFTQRTSNGARSGHRDDAFATTRNRKIEFAGIDGLELELAAELLRVTARWVVAFCAIEQVGDYARGAGDGWVRSGVWDKLDTGAPQFTGDRPAQGAEALAIMHRPGRKRWNGGGGRAIWRHMVEKDRPGHPTPKPVPLMRELVELFTDPGDVVLDPFAGSGTTGVACLRLGRRFIGIERSPQYAAMARERLSAESVGLSLRDARAGQMALLEGL